MTKARVMLLIAATALVAAALAGVFATGSGQQSAFKGDRDAGHVKGDPDARASSHEAPGAQTDAGPASAAEAEAALRAYPAKAIPLAWTQRAQATFATIARRPIKGAAPPGANWTQIGPQQAKYPHELTFTGADYTASGRVTAMAIAPSCTDKSCRLWVAAAGGGIWRTDKALSGDPKWDFISGSFGSNAIGTLIVDPTDASGNTLYAGTGEPNASADSEAGVGIYKTTNGGDTWTLLPGSPAAFSARAIGQIVVDPTNASHLYVGSTRAVRGVTSTSGGALTGAPGAPALGLWESTNGGTTFSLIWNGNGTARGVSDIGLDPSNPNIVYATAYQQGIWRCTAPCSQPGFHQVFAPTNPAFNTNRTMIALTKLPNGRTRIYATDGAQGAVHASFWRVDAADTLSDAALLSSQTVPVAGGWFKKTSSTHGDPYYATDNFCTGQCWYDQDVYTPAGMPDTVYVIGSYQYGELQTGQVFQQGSGISNARAVLYSTTAGDPDVANGNRTFTDMTLDSKKDNPDGIHPDQHAIVVDPNNPSIFFEGSDGGVVRTDGKFSDVSSWCDSHGLDAPSLVTCKQLLSRVPHEIDDMNKNLPTLQFQSFSVDPKKEKHLQGGTQDNGTFETDGSTDTWPQIIYGDGGLSGFDFGNSKNRFNEFTSGFGDVNFQDGKNTKWVIATGPIVASGEASGFYWPMIADPNTAGTIYSGQQHVWRTWDWAGDKSFLEANCPEFTTSGATPTCGDFIPMGADLTDASFGSRAGGFVTYLARSTKDQDTLWASTSTGRLFVTHNARCGTATSAACVTWTRLDSLAANSPGRDISGITADPANIHHAWIAYSGYNAATPATPGHVFEITETGVAATWHNLNVEGLNGDLPTTTIVRDDNTGDLYVGTDFGVLRDPAGGDVAANWVVAGTALPKVEVPDLKIVPGKRLLYAATHGLGGWQLKLS